MVKSKRLTLFLILTFGLTYLFSEEVKEKVIAKYDSSVITASDIALYSNIKEIIADISRVSGTGDRNKAIAENIIFEDLLAQRVIKDGLDKSGNFIKTLEDTKKDVLTDLFMRSVDSSISVTEEEIKNYYDKHIEEFTNPEMRRISYIFFDFGSETPSGEGEKRTLERAKAIEERIKEGENFNDLAIKYSDAPSGRRGGNLGFLPKGKYQSFDKEAWSLKIGEVSEPIKTKYGYCIIKVEEEKESWITPLENVKTLIGDKIRIEKKQKVIDDIKKEYRENKKVVEDFNILNKPKIKDDDVIFHIADFKFTYRDFLNYLDNNKIDRQLRKEKKNEILSRILEDNLYVNIARDKGFDKSEEYQKRIKYIENNRLAKLYVEKKSGETTPTENELQDFFKKNYDMFKNFTSRRISMIFISVGPIENFESTAAVHYAFKRIEPEVNLIKEKLKNGEDFEKLAKEYSDDASAKFGGDVGWIQEPYKKELDGYIRNLKLNEVGEPIKTNDGYYFVKLMDIKLPELNDVKAEVIKMFDNEKRMKIKGELKEELFKECKIEFVD